MEKKLTDINSLVTVKSFATLYGEKFRDDKQPVTRQYIEKLIGQGKVVTIEIDGVRFIDKRILKIL